MTPMDMPLQPELSLIVPMYNEGEVVDRFFEAIEPVLEGGEGCAPNYEIVCVNDGSRDDTLLRLLAHCQRNPRIVVVDLSRNFGKEPAMTAGLHHVRGQAVIPLDADLQDPPELIPQMLELWREGYEVVNAKRVDRSSDSLTKRTTSGWFYRLYNYLADVNIPENVGDFRLMDRRVVDVLNRLPERSRFMKGLFNWVGFRATTVEYERPERVAGQTKFNYWKLWNLALEGITSFSTTPLRVWTYVGAMVALAAFCYMGLLIVRTLAYGVDVPGYASIMVAVLFLGGIQLITLGILGEYIGRIFKEVKGRPVYVVRQIHGRSLAMEQRPQNEGSPQSL